MWIWPAFEPYVIARVDCTIVVNRLGSVNRIGIRILLVSFDLSNLCLSTSLKCCMYELYLVLREKEILRLFLPGHHNTISRVHLFSTLPLDSL